MHSLRIVVLPVLLALAGPAFAQGSDRFEQAVQGSSRPLPDGVPSVSPDALTTGSESPDALDTEASSPDAHLEGAGTPILGHAENPDALTTGSQDLSDLPPASAIDRVPASIAPPPPLPGDCARPAGDAGWNACLSAVQGQMSRASARLDAAEAAYSRSITMHAPTGQARLAIVEERDAARAEVAALRSALASQLAQARQAGVSSWVLAPYQPQTQAW
jgi:hypothetical protein